MRIKLVREGAITPTYATEGSAGADIYSCIDAKIEPNETVMIPTGLAIELPRGLVGLLYPRSGISTKRGLSLINSVGVVDEDYRGEIMVALHNYSTTTQYVNKGERIAQLVIAPYVQERFYVETVLSATERGNGGFGSTGTR